MYRRGPERQWCRAPVRHPDRLVRSQPSPCPGRIVAPMDEPALRQLLDDVRSGVVPPDDAAARLRRLPFADLGFARVDHHRRLRQRVGEAVYAPGKTPLQCALIVRELLSEPGSGPVLLTRADPTQVEAATE